MSTHYKPGEWNAICDRCGFKFKSSELKKDWQGLMVCKDDLEPRHPQTLLRIPTEKAFPEWVRPRPEDSFLPVCYIWERSGFVGLGTIGCMQIGNNSTPYNTLLASRG